jgi:hypothetical protein
MLMESAALDIQGLFEVFAGSATFYPGDSITFEFENGTVLDPMPFYALYNSPGDTGPLATGGDFYNFFVLGFYPAAYIEQLEAEEEADPSDTSSDDSSNDNTSDDSSDPTTDTSDDAPTSWDNPAYPDKPDVIQPDLATDGGGFLTGYFLNDTATGVLSIPSFEEYGDAVGTFSNTIGEFIQRSLEAKMKKIVIDVQQNSGGDVLLAVDAFKQVSDAMAARKTIRMSPVRRSNDTNGDLVLPYP